MSAELRELTDFFENAAIALHWVGPDGTILRVNRAELELLGYSREEYVGRNIAEFHVDAEVIADILRRLSAGETLHNREARLRCKDGSVREVLITSNVQWVEGKFVHTRCFTRDITEHKHAEALQKETIDYLEGLMEGFVAYDGDWIMTYINAAGERLLGRRRAEVIGRTWHEAFPHAVGNPVDLMYQRVMRTRTGESMEYYYPHYRRWLEISASPVRTGGVGVYFRDVSDRKRAEQALRESEAQLREADQRKDEFLATLAHELRNPLAPIRNGLQLLCLAERDSRAAEQARAMMERQTAHLVRLVDDLVEVSRISRGKLELRKEPLELAAVVGSAVEASRPLIESAGHELEIDLPGEAITLHADPVRLAQVLANLLNNAAKYTEAPGRIALRARCEASDAVISVTDNGLGMAPELLGRVFDMFTQGHGSGRGGLGIGLTLARSLVHMHGGSISAHSGGPGKGSEFTVRLPVMRVRRPAAGGEQPASSAAWSTRLPRRVLVVDDNIDAAQSLGLLLEHMGHDVQVVYDGRAALEAARERRPDIVLLDINIPGIDGLGVAQRLREDPRFAELRIVAITGRGHEEDRRRSLQAGIDQHLVKPISAEALRGALEGP